MNSRAEDKQLGASRARLAAALFITALVVSLLARMGGLENRVYDLFQSFQYRTASDQIVLVTDESAEGRRAEIWDADGFGRLVAKLTELGASVVAATQPLDLPEVPSSEQINALAELERQAMRSGGSRDELLGLTSQLAGFRKNFDAQQELARLMQTSGNVLLTVQAGERGDSENLSPQCSAHAANLQGTDPGALMTTRNIELLVAPPAAVCDVSHGIGFNSFQSDTDGVTRRTNLLTNANGTLLPSLALAAWAATMGDNHDIVVAAQDAVMIGDKPFYTGRDFEVLTRHYINREGKPDFNFLSAEDVLSGKIEKDAVAGRIVLVGAATPEKQSALRTPVSGGMSALLLTAADLSNVIDGDYLLRPDWLPLLEYGLLAIILAVVMFWLPQMPAVGAVLVGLFLATFLLCIQAWFLVAEGLWLQLGTVALFALLATWVLQGMRFAHANHKPAARKPRRARNVEATSQHNPLDLEFSVLRQQPVTDDSKERMYKIAFQHGRAEEFAKAERVLSFIAQHDPDYKDVSALLEKLSGRRQYTPLAAEPENSGEAAAGGDSSQTLGRYRIEGKLGQGAMATVYLGADPNIGRKVAIKTVALAQEFDDAKLDEARTQFRREAESAGRLNHPNIIAIYDAGEDGDISYLAMEYFDGDSLLNHASRDNLLPASWVLELMARAADALDYAHRQNVVHRDVKPANIMYHAARDELKLTDFGIARLTDNSRTKTGIILGTPSYMSPEQLTASGVTGQSDLYSLGVTTYQLLTGVAPFRADSIPKLMDKIMNTDHEPLRDLRNDLPDCVDAVIGKALAKEPEDRYPNGRAMAIALRDCAGKFGK